MILVQDQFSVIPFSETMSTTQRKRRSGGSSSSRRSSKRTREMSAPPEMETETIEVLADSMLSSEEVVDLTCEGSEPAVVDLTNTDSVVIVDEGPRGRRGAGGESYVLSSDEEEDISGATMPAFLASLESNSRTRATPGTISCPICMDTYGEIIESGRLIVSTKCGHLFCSQCIRDALKKSATCPACRKKLNHKQYHPIYI
ncbi:E3 ubiquitin-protein ligase RNF4 [Amia ocellicauda]|uniref:E3 ubiquitin-protein ligase RNF4 n=1 Tax=Amia ocellicauda TaxID=2972642 RepID=UPI00346417FD